MTFKQKIHQTGEERILRKFAWLPISTNSKDNLIITKWLERVTVRQRYSNVLIGWINEEFI
jgi:hypothetical protein